MKLLATAVLLLFICSFAQAQSKDWKKFTSDEGRFSVMMPDQPTPGMVSLSTFRGVRESRTFSYSDSSLNDYFVAYSKFREEITAPLDAEQLLNKVQRGILAAEPGKVRSTIALSLEGNPGRELMVEHPDGTFKTHRFYIVGDLFYQLSVEIKTAESRSEKTERFLNSFRLAEPGK